MHSTDAVLGTIRGVDAGSDYGSDFSAEEEGIISELLNSAARGVLGSQSVPPLASTVLRDGATFVDDETAIELPDIEDGLPAAFAAHAADIAGPRPAYGRARTVAFGARAVSGQGETATQSPRSISLGDVRDPDLQHYENLNKDSNPSDPVAVSSEESAPREAPSSNIDTRPPIERFRSFPKKPLSVTDLSSGAWCELQYWYTLSRLPGGRKSQNKAMQGGTKVHQKLEDEVYTTVRVSIAAKEEGFALRLWNVIQGLRTLRETGFTRELEVWGIIDGQVVNGVIDELSYAAPVAGLEMGWTKGDGNDHLDSRKQSSMDDYVEQPRRKIYLTDVKTRGVTKLPTGVAIRPSKIQLFLYHRLLGAMAAGQLDLGVIVSRYGLDPHSRFSDAFMAQMGSLHDDIFNDEEDQEPSSSSIRLEDSMRYRSIEQLSELFKEELRLTFPQGKDTLGETVAIEYRSRGTGDVIGTQTFAADHSALDQFLESNMSWWLGEREAVGVSIEETYKCRSCEFAEACEWRIDKENEYRALKGGERQRGRGTPS